ncbi:dr1-associated corepressor [Lethenteron reissneri]|uniref:dr1-associated corepressor n=1 Tax=Lethenteron reissneri TaxID=7753 RepID=UPI002AB660CA|nr:dr1-associated corepressor [Lethenteron reissneri]
MPSKKKKYNARFPPARIKKIMQTDEEVGKVAAAVPVIISRALELFLESLLTKACQVTQSRNAKTMTTSHLKQCIEAEQQFDFLKDLVSSVPDVQGETEETNADGEKVVKRGRPLAIRDREFCRDVRRGGPGRKNSNGERSGVGAKSKDKKQSESDSDQEEGSEETVSEDEDEEASHSSADKAGNMAKTIPAVYTATSLAGASVPGCRFFPLPVPSVAMPSVAMPTPPVARPPPAADGDDDDDEDYDS